MVIQSWIILGLIAGYLAGMMLGKGFGIREEIPTAIIGGLAGSSLASILFIVSGVVNQANAIAAIIVFVGATILLVVKHVVVQPRTA